MNQREKRGQFYLVAAIVLVAVFIGIVSISNYITGASNQGVIDLKEELKIEGRSVIEYCLSNSLSNAECGTKLKDFADQYISNRKGRDDLYFMFGTSSDVTIKGYQKKAETVILDGDTNTTITEESGEFLSEGIDPGTSSVKLWIGDRDFDFELTEGKNIYFVLHEELNSDEYFVKW